MSRTYARVAPAFWVGDTGRELRRLGRDAQLVALYLITGPSANMIGLYYLPLCLVAHDTGIPLEGVDKALQSLTLAGFAKYDPDREEVWIPEMARHQIGEALKPGDKQAIGVRNELARYAKSQFLRAFVAKYSTAYHLGDLVVDTMDPERPTEGPSQAPPMPGAGAGTGSGSRAPRCGAPAGLTLPGIGELRTAPADLTTRQRLVWDALEEARFYVPGKGDTCALDVVPDAGALARALGGPAYPNVDAAGLIHRLAAWTQTNRAKAKHDLARFLSGRFRAEQDNPRTPAPAPAGGGAAQQDLGAKLREAGL